MKGKTRDKNRFNIPAKYAAIVIELLFENGIYFIGDDGKVRNRKGELMRAERGGYFRTELSVPPELRAQLQEMIPDIDIIRTNPRIKQDVQRIVKILEDGSIPPNRVVHHKNENRSDNSSRNLEIKTLADNGKPPAEKVRHFDMTFNENKTIELPEDLMLLLKLSPGDTIRVSFRKSERLSTIKKLEKSNFDGKSKSPRANIFSNALTRMLYKNLPFALMNL